MACKTDLIDKLNRVILLTGFKNQSMASLAQAIHMSRATLYLYFKNKDDIVHCVLARHCEFIHDHEIPLSEEPAALARNFVSVTLNVLLISGCTTALFRQELKTYDPDCYTQFAEAYAEYIKRAQRFYELAQVKHVMSVAVAPDYLIFQHKTMASQILEQTLAQKITETQAEYYFDQYLNTQMTLLVLPKYRCHLRSAPLTTFHQQISDRFHAVFPLAQ